MITTLEITAYVAVALYILVLLFTMAAYFLIRPAVVESEFSPTVAVVIAVRNEEATIVSLLKSIERQEWAAPFEVIIANDHSTDTTQQRIDDFVADSKLRIRSIFPSGKGKKAALTEAIDISQAEIILVTDGDCEVGDSWIASHVNGFANSRVQFSAGMAAATSGTFFLRDILQTEMIFLQVVSAGMFKLAVPSMCNGASMAFRKTFFIENLGFQNDTFVSGDDIFLLHKAVAIGPEAVTWNCSRGGIVRTKVASSLKDAIAQRNRWLSKIRGYSRLSMLVVGPIFLAVQLLLPAAIFSVFVYPSCINPISIVFVAKSLVELLLLSLASRFFGEEKVIFKFPVSVVVYNLISLCSVFGLVKRDVNWKDRNWKLGKLK